MKEFIESPDFLGGLSIQVSLPINLTIDDFSRHQQLKIIEKFLSYAEKNIRSNYMKEKGALVFEGVAFPELINDYVVEMSKINNKVTDFDGFKNRRNMREYDWYVYN